MNKQLKCKLYKGVGVVVFALLSAVTPLIIAKSVAQDHDVTEKTAVKYVSGAVTLLSAGGLAYCCINDKKKKSNPKP